MDEHGVVGHQLERLVRGEVQPVAETRELQQAERYPVPLAALVQFVADHLEGLPAATEASLLERAAQGLPGGKARLSRDSRKDLARDYGAAEPCRLGDRPWSRIPGAGSARRSSPAPFATAVVEILSEVCESGSNVRWPIGVEVLLLDPWQESRELVRCRGHRQAVGEIEAPIT